MPLTCAIPNKHVRIFSRCVHSLHKMSEEFVYIKVCPEGLILKCVNQACTVFGNFAFRVSFFNYFKLYNTGKKEEDSITNYKISVKGIFHVFKSLTTVDKSVENCVIEVTCDHIMLKLDCKMGVEKVFNLPIVNFETLKSFCTVDGLTNSFACTSRLISSAIGIFNKADEEMIMEIDKEAVIFRNFIKGAYNFNSSIHSQTSLEKSEFMKYSNRKSTTLQFYLKEFRSILTLADNLGQDLDLSFEAPNQPILIKLNSERNYDVTFILSTISDSEDSLNISTENACITDLLQSSSEKDFTDPLPNPKKLCQRVEKNKSALIDVDSDNEVDMDITYDSKSFLQKIDFTPRSSNTLPDASTSQSHATQDLDQTLVLTQPTKQFRLEILADMEQDYFNTFMKNAVVLASETDEETD